MSLNTTPGEYSYTFKYSFKCSWILRRPSSEICIFWEPVSWKYIAFTDLHVLVLLLVAAWIFPGNLPFCFMKWVVSLDMYLSMKYSWKMHIWTTLLSLWSITLYSNYTNKQEHKLQTVPSYDYNLYAVIQIGPHNHNDLPLNTVIERVRKYWAHAKNIQPPVRIELTTPGLQDSRFKTFIGITVQEHSFTKRNKTIQNTHVSKHSQNHSLAANTYGAWW